MPYKRALESVCAFVLFAGISFGQVAGRVTGLVLDGSGASIPGAGVTLHIPAGAAVYTSKTATDGHFTIASVKPGVYDLIVDAAGFRQAAIHGVVVDPARESAVRPVTLQLGGVSQVLEVPAGVQTVQTNNAEITSTITNGQIQNLPVADRYVLGFIATQAGVNDYLQTNSTLSTTINGQRPSYSNVTFAGINIQDNYLRTNPLDFTPNLLTLDQVQEVTVSTSNANATMGGGASHV
ncbi:MAG: carboxypeptidase-like regulatory domain-containing protein, partial [Bryobacteraceae bacterium]